MTIILNGWICQPMESVVTLVWEAGLVRRSVVFVVLIISSCTQVMYLTTYPVIFYTSVKVNNNMILQSTPDDNYKEKDYRFSVGTISENLDRDNFAVSVTTSLGQFIGNNNDERFTNTEFVTNGVDSFLGIKYGRIPGRFRKSQLYEQRRDFIDATDFGPFCWQSVDMPWYEDQQQSEDVSSSCLDLQCYLTTNFSPC